MLESHKDACPYCGERIELLLDPSMAGASYTEDCEVCCRPMLVSVWAPGDSGFDGDSWAGEVDQTQPAALQASVRREDEV